jgi:hypothetical protein
MTPLVTSAAISRRRLVFLLAGVLAAQCLHAPRATRADEAESAAVAKTAAPPECVAFRIRPQDEVWAVSTRCLPCPSGAEGEIGWSVWKYDPLAPQWRTASSEEFHAGHKPDAVTAMYVHGNQIDRGLALRDGLDTYFQLAGRYDAGSPVRFVIWSWPSDKIHGPINDGRTKAWRADAEAYYLARFLAPVPDKARVGIVGYSYGARITAGALHMHGGGDLDGLTVASATRPTYRVVFWAAAEHDDWLVPYRRHWRAIDMAEHWLITRNYCDPALSRYGWIEKGWDPVALGYSGMVGRNLLTAEQNARIEEIDVTSVIGKTHDNDAYLYAPWVAGRTREVVVWVDQ